MKFPLLRLVLVGSVLAFVASFTARAESAGAKPAVPPRISQGERVTLSEHLVKGKITIFDFTSEYCPPCRQIGPLLDELHRRRDDVAVVKVDINRPDIKRIDWQSPVAQQFGLRSIPHFKIFDQNGHLVSEGQEAYDEVTRWLER